MNQNKNFFTNKSLLITGGTGSLGNAILDYFIEKKIILKKIIIFSRDEWKQYEMQKKYNFSHKQNLRFFLGDVRDKERLSRALNDVDIIIHAAAIKQVDKAELEPIEAIKTNIYGAQNVVECALSSDVKIVAGVSTDKASSPINLYGATKLCSEKLITSAENIKGKNKIYFTAIRYGNVLNSRGSIMPLFLNQSKKNQFTITNPSMTRFLMTLRQSVEFILKSIIETKGGEIFIPKLPSFRVVDLAKSINSKASLKIIGIRPGEKMHEELISKDDSVNTIETSDYFVIINTLLESHKSKKKLETLYKGKFIKKQFSYNSLDNNKYCSVEDLRKLVNI